MYVKSINFNLSVKDYEKIRDVAHETRGTIAGLLREGASMVLDKYGQNETATGKKSRSAGK